MELLILHGHYKNALQVLDVHQKKAKNGPVEEQMV